RGLDSVIRNAPREKRRAVRPADAAAYNRLRHRGRHAGLDWDWRRRRGRPGRADLGRTPARRLTASGRARDPAEHAAQPNARGNLAGGDRFHTDAKLEPKRA